MRYNTQYLSLCLTVSISYSIPDVVRKANWLFPSYFRDCNVRRSNPGKIQLYKYLVFVNIPISASFPSVNLHT